MDFGTAIRDGFLAGARAGAVCMTAKDNRLFVEGVLYPYRTGVPWRDPPALLTTNLNQIGRKPL